jgi:hypothetical protein
LSYYGGVFVSVVLVDRFAGVLSSRLVAARPVQERERLLWGVCA